MSNSSTESKVEVQQVGQIETEETKDESFSESLLAKMEKVRQKQSKKNNNQNTAGFNAGVMNPLVGSGIRMRTRSNLNSNQKDRRETMLNKSNSQASNNQNQHVPEATAQAAYTNST